MITSLTKRRFVILADGRFSPLGSKTANQVIRYLPEQVIAVVDRLKAGSTVQEVLGFGGEIPVVADLAAALPRKPDTLLIGIAPTGGILPDEWRTSVCEAIGNGLDVVSGLHSFLSEDPEFCEMAETAGVCLYDLRKVSAEYQVVAKGLWKTRRAKTILTVGTDCNTGKMTASLELHREFLRRRLKSAFIATGQTGILLAGSGVAVDSLVADYVAGAVEHELELADPSCQFLHVEGQGSITHQGYSAVTAGLLHGVMPDAMILVHHPARAKDAYGLALSDVAQFITLYESMVSPFKPTKVVGIALNTALMPDDDVKESREALRRQTGLPVADVLRGEAGVLADALVGYFAVPSPHGPGHSSISR
jgi:uncharacterized NAD-dependent epimerase/dehydratase family protein